MYHPFRILNPFYWTIICPLLAWILLFLANILFASRKAASSESSTEPELIRPAFLRATTLYGAWLVGSMELLSLGGNLNRATLTVSWLVLVIAVIVFLKVSGHLGFGPGKRVSLPGLGAVLERLKSKIAGATRGDRLVALFLFLWLGVLLVIAWIAAPNNYDSMTYHLPRVMEWIQNGSVHFFPTHILRQNYLAPFAEWNLLNLRILAGNDHLFNSVQWFCYLGGCVAISLIAQLLGAGKKGMWLAILFFACTPMAILQATSTQNDLVAGYFLLCFIYFGLVLSDGSRQNRDRCFDAALCGLSLGLGLLTKSTIYLFAFPFVLFIAARLLYSCRWRALSYGSILSACVVMVLAGHAARNFAFYHQLLGPPAEYSSETAIFKFQNDQMDMGRFCYSSLRNLGLHGNIDGMPKFRHAIQAGVQGAARWLGVPEDDPATTWLGTTFELSKKRHEDVAGNFPQVVVFLLACALLPFMWRDSKAITIYCLCIITGGFLFVVVLRWQPWHTRLHLPLFMAMAPFCGSVFGAFRTKGLAAIIVLASALVYYSFPFLTMNCSRPLLGSGNVFNTKRDQQYFAGNSALRRPYKNAVSLLKKEHCKSVGLQTGSDDFQYPFWVLAECAGIPNTRFVQVNVNNASKVLNSSFIPDAVITTSLQPSEIILVESARFRCSLKDKGVAVYLRE